MSCNRTMRFNAWAPGSQRVSKPMQVDHIHPQRVADAEEFGFDAKDVFVFAKTVGVDFTSAVLMMDEQRSRSSK